MRRLGKKVNLLKSIDVDEIPIRRYSFYANAYVVELPLDSQPDLIWQTIFEQEWRSSLHLWDRKVSIVGDKLFLITAPSEIEEKIGWLMGILKSANLRVEEFNQTQQTVEEAEEAELREHKVVFRQALRRKLTFG